MAEKNSLEMVVDPTLGEVEPLSLPAFPGGDKEGFNTQVALFETQILSQALETCSTTRELARSLKMTQSQAVRKLQKHGLSHRLKRNRRKQRRRNKPGLF